MIGLQLYIEGQQVELHGDESVVLTQSLQDVKDIQKVFTNFSRTFNVPASKNNNKIFKHFHQFNIKGFDARKKKDAELHLNYKLFKKGKIKLEGVQLKDNKPQNYKLTFYGKIVNLKDIIGDDKLDALSQLADFSLEYSADNNVTLLNTAADIFTNGENFEDALLVPLITHTQRLYYDSSEDIANTGNLHYGGSEVKGVDYDQLKPAIRVYAIIKAIERQYRLTFSDDFFNKTNSAFYNLYLWLHRKKGGVLSEDETNVEQQVTNFTNFIIQRATTEFNGGLNRSFFKNRIYRDPTEVNRDIKVTVQTTPNVTYDLTVKKNGQEWFKKQNVTASSTGIDTYIDYAGTKKLDAGEDIYTFHIKSADTATFTVKVEVKENYKVFLGWRTRYASMTGSVSVSTDVNIDSQSQVPEIGVMDFLTGLFKMFNLTAYQDDEEIVVLPLDDFYASSTQSYDITKFLDRGESQVNTLLPYREITFEYKGKDSFFSSFHKQLFNRDWGSAYYDNKGVFDGPSYSITLPFEHHKFERIYDADTNTRTSVQWGWSVDDTQEAYKGSALLFYPYLVTGGDSISVKKTASQKVEVTSYYIPSNQVHPNLQTQSINFGAELNEYVGLTEENSLFKTYYSTYITETFDINRRLTVLRAYLPMSFILNIKLQDKIIVVDDVYKINKMTTDLLTGLTTFELINNVTDYDVVGQKYIEAEQAQTIDTDQVFMDTTLVTADNSIIRF